MTIGINDLNTSYRHCTTKLIPFLMNARQPKQKQTIKLTDLDKLFSAAALWIAQEGNTGHRKFIHKITQVVIEYPGHAQKKDPTLPPFVQRQIFNQIEDHVNIMGNDIFRYVIRNWKEKPDYPKALENYEQWLKNR